MVKCVYYKIARTQRFNEMERGEGLRGTKGYEERGCYRCTGFKKECPIYEPQRMRRRDLRGLLK